MVCWLCDGQETKTLWLCKASNDDENDDDDANSHLMMFFIVVVVSRPLLSSSLVGGHLLAELVSVVSVVVIAVTVVVVVGSSRGEEIKVVLLNFQVDFGAQATTTKKLIVTPGRARKKAGQLASPGRLETFA